jgi:hypothetical protein
MCPSNLFLQFAIIIALLAMVYGYRCMFKNAKLNFRTLAGLLEAPLEKKGFLKMSLEGHYKGRKVNLTYLFTSKNNNFFGPSIELRFPVKKQKLFCIDYQRVTQSTQLKGNRVFYNPRIGSFALWCKDASRTSWGDIRVYSEQELNGILEELTQAAETVEKDPGRF